MVTTRVLLWTWDGSQDNPKLPAAESFAMLLGPSPKICRSEEGVPHSAGPGVERDLGGGLFHALHTRLGPLVLPGAQTQPVLCP